MSVKYNEHEQERQKHMAERQRLWDILHASEEEHVKMNLKTEEKEMVKDAKRRNIKFPVSDQYKPPKAGITEPEPTPAYMMRELPEFDPTALDAGSQAILFSGYRAEQLSDD